MTTCSSDSLLLTRPLVVKRVDCCMMGDRLCAPAERSLLQNLLLTAEEVHDLQTGQLGPAARHVERPSCCMQSSSCSEWHTQRQRSDFLYHDLYSLQMLPSVPVKRGFQSGVHCNIVVGSKSVSLTRAPQPARKNPMHQQKLISRARR
jgi:hypothetical protein